MLPIERIWLSLAAALALGESLALVSGRLIAFWPAILFLAVLVALFGFGRKWTLWPYVAIGLLGLSLALSSSVGRARVNRETPWMRTADARVESNNPLTPLKRTLSRRVGLGLEHEPRVTALNRAILLGERANLSGDVKRAFVDSGSIHVFAVSGLHVMAIARVFMVFVALFGVSARWQGFLAMPLVWLYVMLIGAPPSAIRAAVMASIYVTAPIFWRRPNGPIAWAMTFIGVHLLSPDQIANVGSLFSFTVMLALIFAARYGRGLVNPLGKLLYFTFAAWAAGVPIAAVAFGRLTLSGLLSNLVLVGLAVNAVVSGIVGLFLSFVWEPLAVHFNNFSAIVTKLMLTVAEGVSRLPGASFDIPRWGVSECILWYLAMALFFYLVYRRTRPNLCR